MGKAAAVINIDQEKTPSRGNETGLNTKLTRSDVVNFSTAENDVKYKTTEEIIRELNKRLSEIPELVSGLTKESPNSLHGVCPICGKGTDRFVYRTDSKYCWTRSCGCIPQDRPWDKIAFHQYKEGCDLIGLAKKHIPNFKEYPKGTWQWLDKYNYLNADGKLIYQVRRAITPDGKKVFPQRRPDEKGGWIKGLGNIRRLPFNLQGVLRADVVYLPEGEKDVNNLKKIGLTASCNSGGAGNWPDEITPYFKDKKIILLPDNDDPGRKHAESLTGKLHGVAREVKVVELPCLPEKGDITDWIEAGHTKQELLDIVEQTTPWEPEEADLDNELPYITLEKLYVEKMEERPIAKGFLEEQEQTIIYAPGGTGKSLASLHLALFAGASPDLANGTDLPLLWGQFPVPKPRTTLFLQSENSKRATHSRIHKMVTGTPEFGVALANIFCPNIHGDIRMAGYFSDEGFRSKIIDLIRTIEDKETVKVDLMVVDPLISFHEADENDNSRMRSTLDWLAETANEAEVTPIVIHHANKEEGIRGASSIVDWARCVVKLKPVSINGQHCIRFEHEKTNNLARFEPFIMAVDEDLNFNPVEEGNYLSHNAEKRGGLVLQALQDLSGCVETQNDLIAQYCALSAVKETTAHRHVSEAVENGVIIREPYQGEKNIRQYRFRIPKSGES